MSKKYELLLVLPGTLDENAAAVRCEEIVSLVKESASDVEMNVLGKSRLAYPVKQIRYGYFYTIVFSAETDGLKVIKTKLELMRDLLRAMLSVFYGAAGRRIGRREKGGNGQTSGFGRDRQEIG